MSRGLFLIFYLVGMLPTYLLPYFGSNSTLMQSVSALTLQSNLGLTWTILHIGALALCIYVAWARGTISGKKTLVALPVIAAIFDMVPMLSAIPLVPTVLHIIALVQGFGSEDSNDSSVPVLAKHPLLGVLAISITTSLTAAVLLITGITALNTKSDSLMSKTSRPRISAVPTTSQQSPVKQAATLHPEPPSPLLAVKSPIAPPSQTGFAPSAPPALPTTNPTMDPHLEAEIQRKSQELAKTEAAKAHILALNTIIESRETSAMATQYAESFMAYVTNLDPAGAATVFGGLRVEADNAVNVFFTAKSSAQKISYQLMPPALERASDPSKPNGLRIEVRRDGVSTLVVLRITLNDSGNKFIVMP